MPPLSLYLHIPWCLKKCPYCDFNSHEKREDVPEAEYVDAVVADLEATLPKVWGRRIGTIFIGGGTPSLFSPQAIDRLLTAVRTRIGVDPEAEITMEANRRSSARQGYREAGVVASRSACRASMTRVLRPSGACMAPTRRVARWKRRSRFFRR